MKNFLGKFRSMPAERKKLYLLSFMFICFFTALPLFSAHAGLASQIVQAIAAMIIPWAQLIVYWVIYIIFKFACLLVYFASWLIDMLLDPDLYKSILVGVEAAGGERAQGAVELGWETVRDFCNMFYVFFLLLIAFGTITGSSKYNYKNLLPKFVISLFLINFSDTITMMVIDVGQVFLFGMAAWLGTFSGSQGSGSSLTGIVNYFEMALTQEKPSFEDIITVIFAALYTFMLAGTYLVLAGLLLVRLVMFAALIIISPFAFFSLVLPSMGKYTSQWLSSLISNALSGPVMIFFIYVSAMMAKTLVDGTSMEDPVINIETGDISNMAYMRNILTIIVPHIVALGILWFGIVAAKSVGGAGANLVVGGRLGMGKMLGAGYAGFKLGERTVRRSAGYARDVGVRNFKKVAQADDSLHQAYQNTIKTAGNIIPMARGTATNMVLKDQAAQEAAKKRMYDERLKQAGGNLKAIDVDLALKGDNISKAIGLNAAAEQGKLVDLDEKGNFKYMQYFNDAASVMTAGDIKALSDKNIAFSLLSPENRSKTVSSFSGEARDRIENAIALGVSPDKAVQDEIMREKFSGLIDKGEDGKIQGVANKDVARVMAKTYSNSQFNDAIKRMNKDKKSKLSKALAENVKDTEKARQNPKNAAHVGDIQKEKLKLATFSLKSGAELKDALAKDITDPAEYDDQVKKLMKEMDASTIASMQYDDLEKYGHHVEVRELHNLNKKREDVALKHIEEAVKRMPDGPEKEERIKAFKAINKS